MTNPMSLCAAPPNRGDIGRAVAVGGKTAGQEHILGSTERSRIGRVSVAERSRSAGASFDAGWVELYGGPCDGRRCPEPEPRFRVIVRDDPFTSPDPCGCREIVRYVRGDDGRWVYERSLHYAACELHRQVALILAFAEQQPEMVEVVG